MTRIEVRVSGCDDATVFEMRVDDSEFAAVQKFVERMNEASEYGCQPTAEIREVHSEA